MHPAKIQDERNVLPTKESVRFCSVTNLCNFGWWNFAGIFRRPTEFPNSVRQILLWIIDWLYFKSFSRPVHETFYQKKKILFKLRVCLFSFFNFRTLSILLHYYAKIGAGILTLNRTRRQSLVKVKMGYRNWTGRTDQIFTVCNKEWKN